MTLPFFLIRFVCLFPLFGLHIISSSFLLSYSRLTSFVLFCSASFFFFSSRSLCLSSSQLALFSLFNEKTSYNITLCSESVHSPQRRLNFDQPPALHTSGMLLIPHTPAASSRTQHKQTTTPLTAFIYPTPSSQ